MPDTYVACAMSALPAEEYEELRQAILAVCTVLRTVGRVPYSEPFEITGGHFEEPATVLEKNFRVLDAVSLFVLVYTHKQTTSALIELGYVLHRHIPVIVYAKEGIKLPYYLRESHVNAAHDIQVVSFGTHEELVAKANGTLTATVHSDSPRDN